MKEMVELVESLDPVIPVDIWDTEEYPVQNQSDIYFKSIRGQIILPISEFFYTGEDCDKHRQLDYFTMNSKRSYNSEETRNHICRYLNYFLKYYDTDKELLMIIYKLKVNIDYIREYSIDNFMDDVNLYIIMNPSLGMKIKRFVRDNYNMKLGNNGGKTPNLQFDDCHAKILYEISLMSNIYIPLATHYMYLHFIKNSSEIKEFMRRLFDMCSRKYELRDMVDIYNKLYEIGDSVVNKSKSSDKALWDKNMIRGNNPTTHIKDSLNDMILQIIPKYSYTKNIINFNYYSSRQSLRFKITDICYEYPFIRMSSSKRDADENSEIDRYESSLSKKDESLYLMNKVAADQAIMTIEQMYGPFSDNEIEYYRKRLVDDGGSVINRFQKQLIWYFFYKFYGDPITVKSNNQTDYIKLMIALKRILLKEGLVILPYIISSRVTRIASRKTVNKKETLEIKSCEAWQQIVNKYNNPKIEQLVLEIIATIISSSFEIIDYDPDSNCPGQFDGFMVPIINDLINSEVLSFILMI